MKLRLWLPDGPEVFERDEIWCIMGVDLGDPCDSGFWDADARTALPYFDEFVYELPLEVDE